MVLGDKSTTKVQPDGDALLVIGREEGYGQVVDALKAIDVTASNAGKRAHVVRLEHANAQETAEALNNVITAPAKGPTTRPVAAPAAAAVFAPGQSPLMPNDVKVGFSKPTNSLIITASEADFRSIRELVRALDIARPQVYIEAIIMESTVDDDRMLGVSWNGGAQVGQMSVLTAQTSASANIISAVKDPSTLGTGLAAAILGPSISLLGLSIPSLGAVFKAARTNSIVNILSQPEIMATDNEDSHLVVGSQVPRQTSQPANNGTAFVQPAAIVLEPVTLDLKLKPHVGSAGDVRVELTLDIKDIGIDTPLGQTFTTRTLQTMVTVHDGDPIVLGGLMRHEAKRKDESVPILGDIPILGALFRSRETEHKKLSLLVVLVPHIVPDAAAGAALLERKLRQQREFEASLDFLGRARWEPDVDVRKKHGLLADIDGRVRSLDVAARAP
jgi:general secretion pathway protein D